MISDFFDINKPIGRKVFLLISLIYAAIITCINYAIVYFSPAGFPGSKNYFILKLFLGILFLFAFMLPAIKRARDIGIPLWFLIIFWIIYPFDLRNTLIIKEYFGIEIDQDSIPVYIIMLSGLFLSLALLFKSGRHNKQL